jgi:glycosyltransferase involved in cell wall biosynthesis
VELLAVLDNPNDLTREIFEAFAATRPDLKIKTVSHADLGFSRNTAAQQANGKWIAFLDADDIWCEQWLVLAHEAAEADPRKIAWHPEVNAYFGVTPNILLHVDMEDPAFRVADLAHTNLWTSLCFTSTDFLRSVPYAGTDLKNNIGYEDWCWNIDVVNNGGIHKVVPNTAHAVRTRSVSLVKQTTAAGCIPRPSDFFRNIIEGKLPAVASGALPPAN